jgi:hypothetical protein
MRSSSTAPGRAQVPWPCTAASLPFTQPALKGSEGQAGPVEIDAFQQAAWLPQLMLDM